METKYPEIKCADFTFSITLGFWSKFSQLKLNQLKLNEEPLTVKGTYQFAKGYKALLELDQYSFLDFNENSIQIKGGYLRSQSIGYFVNYNTLDQMKKAFSNYDDQLNKVLNQKFGKIQFVIFAYSDLKNFSFHYFVAYLKAINRIQMQKAIPISKFGFGKEEIQVFETAIESLKAKVSMTESNYINQFLQLNQQAKLLQPLNFTAKDKKPPIIFMLDPSSNLPSILIHSLFRQIYAQKIDIQQPNEFIIVLLRQKLTAIQKSKTDLTDQNIVIKVSLHPQQQTQKQAQVPQQLKNVKLKQFLDPKQLAAQAVWLNLKLMKWRAAPSLDLDVIAPTKCLLFGSGSLGCQVSRQLLAWGFSNITLIDNGKISHSNPVRQSLFTYQNAAHGNQFKAERAAKAILEICPSANVQAINMTIPMPGHPPASSKQESDEYISILNDVEKVQTLVKEHDAIFLLTDNRQSRWLPTVLCALHDKICITAALGFDTYVVMRHGCVQNQKLKDEQSNEEEKKNTDKFQRLGCYFCGDIVAPQNSMKDRTLDQQCTVSRPALCPMASSWAVQLLVSILNHPEKQRAKGHEELFQCDQSILGPIPQQIRGNLRSFQNLALCGYSFEKCVACSGKIIEAYTENKEKLIRAVLQNSDYLEDISGITEMKQALDGEDIDEFVID